MRDSLRATRGWPIPFMKFKAANPPPHCNAFRAFSCTKVSQPGGTMRRLRLCLWLLLAESHLTRRPFEAMLRRIALLPLPAG
jgi:hypothetical protein